MKIKALLVKNAYWLFLGGLALLLGGAAFTPELDRVILLYLVVGGVFMNPEQLVATWFFIMCFDGLSLNFSFMHDYLITLLAGHYCFNFIHHRQVVNQRLLLVLVVFSLYIMLTATVFTYYTVYIIFCFVMFVLVYEQRQKIAFSQLLKVLAIGLIISGIGGILANKLSSYWNNFYPPILAENGDEGYLHDYYRFQALTRWATQYAGLAAVAVSGLLLARYQKRINDYWFYLLWVPVYIFAYQTLTRTFILCVVVALVIYGIMCLYRDRWQAWRALVPLAGSLMAVTVIFYTATMGNWERIFHDDAMSGYSYGSPDISEEEWAAIKNGSSQYYPLLGRKVQWAYYATDLFSAWPKLLFGQGMHVLFAGHTPHNWYLFFAWRYGLLGIILLGTMWWLMADWRQWRTKRFWRRLAPGLLFLIPVLVQGIFDDNGFWAQMSIMLAIIWCYEQPRLVVSG